MRGGQTLKKSLALIREFRAGDDTTPIVLMGYYNPIYIYGVEAFLADAKAAGVDGLIVVDLPPEEDAELCLPALAAGLNFIRLATPTTDDKRLPAVLANTSGFVYYVSITGITGSATPDAGRVGAAVARIKRHTGLPVAVGFGVKTSGARTRHRRRGRPPGRGPGVRAGLCNPRPGRQGDRHGRTAAPAIHRVASLGGRLGGGVLGARECRGGCQGRIVAGKGLVTDRVPTSPPPMSRPDHLVNQMAGRD